MPNEPLPDIRPLVQRLGKPPFEWRRQDLVDLCCRDGIRVLNLRYPSLDGKLRELRLPINDRRYLERLLAAGERVDGSSLFPGLFPTGESDLYAVPVYRWAFLDPGSSDELSVVCRFADRDGTPAPTPDNLLAAAAGRLTTATGFSLSALAELEFYLILDRGDDRFAARAQRNYHQSAPYLHGRAVADDILRAISAVTGNVKYCHSEVGVIDRMDSDLAELHGRRLEQYEVEFDLMPVEDLGTWLTVARWLVRLISDRHGASVTFAPKLDEDMAGSGLHLHLALNRDGRNVMTDATGQLSPPARQLIGGLLGRAAPLTAFGNTVASSFLRLVPGQEAPTRICWGHRNRTSLVRVPLDFATEQRLDQVMNPGETGQLPPGLSRPTIEYRSPDGSAFPHLLLAAVTFAAHEGLTSDHGTDLADRLEAREDRPLDRFDELPASAASAARALDADRSFLEREGFPSRLIDFVCRSLKAEEDEDLGARLRRLPAAERLRESRRLMHKDLHKH